MFKEGQIYKVKVELSPDVMGFGRATVLFADTRRICVQLKSSKGSRLNLPRGTKIWFVGSSSNNRFNGVWSSEVTGTKVLNGHPALECKSPRFEQHLQRRTQSRMELTAPVKISGDEWKDISVKTRNISRFGLGLAAAADCAERFAIGTQLAMQVDIGEINLQGKVKVVNSRFNWLMNRTEIGVEFADLDVHGLESLERLLVWLGNKPQGAKAGLTESGSLSRWVRPSKDTFTFVKQGGVDGEDEGDDSDVDEEDFEGDPGIE